MQLKQFNFRVKLQDVNISCHPRWNEDVFLWKLDIKLEGIPKRTEGFHENSDPVQDAGIQLMLLNFRIRDGISIQSLEAGRNNLTKTQQRGFRSFKNG